MPKWSWDALAWTFVEGALPIIGVSLLFLGMGLSGAFSAEEKKFADAWSKFKWRFAFDPIGWVYGSTLLAVHVFKEGRDAHAVLAYLCLILAGIAVFLLAQALNHRKERPTYDAPTRMQVFAVLMVVVVLVASYVVRADGGEKGKGGGPNSTAGSGVQGRTDRGAP